MRSVATAGSNTSTYRCNSSTRGDPKFDVGVAECGAGDAG